MFHWGSATPENLNTTAPNRPQLSVGLYSLPVTTGVDPAGVGGWRHMSGPRGVLVTSLH